MSLPFTITYDKVNLRVQMSGSTGAVVEANVAELYSHWKGAMTSDAGLMSLPPVWLSSVGGQDLGGGTALDGYFFLNNEDGWKLAPEDRDHELRINGNLYASDPGESVWYYPTADVATSVILTSRAIVVNSSVTSADIEALRNLIRADHSIIESGEDAGKLVVSDPEDKSVIDKYTLYDIDGNEFDPSGNKGIGRRTLDLT